MKLLIFILLASLKLIGQTKEEYVIENLHTYMKSKPKWTAISRGPKTSSENKLITSIIMDSTHTFCDVWKTGSNYFDNFHFIDLDGDKDLDLIFQGLECGGFESETVLIYMNINNQYKEVLKVMGRISSLTKNSELIIYEYPCCAMIENTMIEYKIHKDSLIESFGFTFFYSFILDQPAKNTNNILQHHLKKDKTYTLKKDSGVNYFPCDSIATPIFKRRGSEAKVTSDISVSTYTTFTDSYGVKWLYCKIPKENILVINERSKFPFLAWVKLTK